MINYHCYNIFILVNCEIDDAIAFLNEGLIMKKFKHRNVLSLIGISFETDETPILVMPLMINDLLSHLRKSLNKLNIHQLITFAIDIAKGELP